MRLRLSLPTSPRPLLFPFTPSATIHQLIVKIQTTFHIRVRHLEIEGDECYIHATISEIIHEGDIVNVIEDRFVTPDKEFRKNHACEGVQVEMPITTQKQGRHDKGQLANTAKVSYDARGSDNEEASIGNQVFNNEEQADRGGLSNRGEQSDRGDVFNRGEAQKGEMEFLTPTTFREGSARRTIARSIQEITNNNHNQNREIQTTPMPNNVILHRKTKFTN
jgi:hypothetical protein